MSTRANQRVRLIGMGRKQEHIHCGFAFSPECLHARNALTVHLTQTDGEFRELLVILPAERTVRDSGTATSSMPTLAEFSHLRSRRITSGGGEGSPVSPCHRVMCVLNWHCSRKRRKRSRRALPMCGFVFGFKSWLIDVGS